jgi:hypothetical protein
MNVKIIAGIAFAALLAGCGGANDHPEELKGTWSTGCVGNIVDTYIFDSGLTLMSESYSIPDCTKKRTTVQFKLNALYDPELKTTSSGIEALKAELTLAAGITFTPHDSFSLQSYKNTCPQQSWQIDQETSIMACGHVSARLLIASFEPNLPTLFYIDGNNLYASKNTSPKGEDGFPLDVDYGKYYMKQ